MSSKRKIGSSTTNFNFRPQSEAKKWEAKGTKPLPNPVTIQETLLTMIIHVCRKMLFFNTNLRVGLYMAGLFLSFIFDVLPFPKSYFGRSDNVFNQYFVKIGWGWTLLLSVPFVFLTSFTYCCGNRKMVLSHLSRLGIATVAWFIFTTVFSSIDNNFGKCSKARDIYKTRKSCVSSGYSWESLDISGHIFILMWSSLVIVEEAKVINGWESVKDMIRNEMHSRSTNVPDFGSPLRKLSDPEFQIMRSSYRQFTPYIKLLFITMTGLTIIWDIMIVSTILYFHVMIEKLIAGLAASVIWFLTYKYWYVQVKYPPEQPGNGLFKYIKEMNKQNKSLKNKQSNSNVYGKKFGQMPNPITNIQGYKGHDKISKDDLNSNQEQELSRKTTEVRNTQDEHSMKSASGMSTRSQTLRSFRINGNNTI